MFVSWAISIQKMPDAHELREGRILEGADGHKLSDVEKSLTFQFCPRSE